MGVIQLSSFRLVKRIILKWEKLFEAMWSDGSEILVYEKTIDKGTENIEPPCCTSAQAFWIVALTSTIGFEALGDFLKLYDTPK